MPLQEIFENQTAKVRFWWHLRDRVTNARGSGCMPLQEIFENQTAKVHFWWYLRDRE